MAVDESGEGKEVEQVGEVFPDVLVSVLPDALVVESVNLSDLA